MKNFKVVRIVILIFLVVIIFLAVKFYWDKKMTSPPPPAEEPDIKVTLLEGWRIEEMGNKLQEKLGIRSEDFIKDAQEGYMFPDTYLFALDTKVSEIVQKLRENFDKKYSPTLQAKIKNLGLTSEQGVILASIVEREARSDEARRMVASILLKRFKIGMGLNADATIQYALVIPGTSVPPSFGWWKRTITKEDKEIKSAYNTYLYHGFPPGPICNSSLSAFNAAASADPKTPYLYYYHDSKGNSYYAKTLEEHNENVARYP
ncbi:MAG: endolytic transglycosylase MltG [Candidatus Daviesbacteria bacterium]